MPSTVLGGMFVILWHVCNSFIKYEKSIFNKLQKIHYPYKLHFYPYKFILAVSCMEADFQQTTWSRRITRSCHMLFEVGLGGKVGEVQWQFGKFVFHNP
jgi:hypothetical protein